MTRKKGKFFTLNGTFSGEATISRLDLSDFLISILGYSQNRRTSFDSRRINEARPYTSLFIGQS